MCHRVQKTKYRRRQARQAYSRVPLGDEWLHYRDYCKWPLYVTVPLPYGLGTAYPAWQRKLFACTSDKFCSHTYIYGWTWVCVSMQESVRVQLAHMPPAGMQALGGMVRCGYTLTYGCWACWVTCSGYRNGISQLVYCRKGDYLCMCVLREAVCKALACCQ